MKVCFYAINGHGLGHLSRCYAIAKRLRELVLMVGGKPDIQILTTSEADHVVEGFPVFKIPSRSCFKGQKGAASRYKSNGKMMISAMMSHFSPDVLVMDTVATGSFQEFTFIKDFARKTVLVERHKNEEYASSAIHQSHLNLFDKVIVPDTEDRLADYVFPEAVKEKVEAVGMIHNFDHAQSYSRQQARERFGVKDDSQKLVYLSAGGGGDENAKLQIEKVMNALKESGCKVVVGYGPLSRAPKPYGDEDVVVFTEPNVNRYFYGFDLAISAAGYNTYEELMAAKVPSLFFAQEKGMDMQGRRVEYGVRAGWHGVLDFDGNLLEQIQGALECGRTSQLEQRSCPTGAVNAAKQLASLNVEKEELLLELELASVAQELHQTGLWSSPEIVEAYQIFNQCVRSSQVSKRMRQTLETLTAYESGTDMKDWAAELQQAERIRLELEALEIGTVAYKKRFMHFLQRKRCEVNTISAENVGTYWNEFKETQK